MDKGKIIEENIGSPKKEFSRLDVDPDVLLANQKYSALYAREGKRQDEFSNRPDLSALSDTEFDEGRRLVNEANEQDEKETLLPDETKEFWYFMKFASVERSKDGLDPLMYEISREFNRLPFKTWQSCTNHVDEGTNTIEDDFRSAIVFSRDLDTPEDEQLQIDFIQGLTELNINICERLGVNPYDVLQLRGYLFDDGTELSIEECFREGLEMNLYTNISPEVGDIDGRETLSVVWQEFWSYLQKFTGRNLPQLDTQGGEVFIKK